ncbi:Scarecrow-like protein 28 [Capsicum chinense]|uniref:scarecrow-like protein 28 n=1 Tax=Capsicum annuum TaxID=4072 RepID=UPI000C0E40A2|nr:scarecrow-like protein 28 [Capsicum annuum]KAF3664694.1 Scarecrow-like protein 28 [Capsicum annuum]PHU28277.1 Scarecrow-like protein 28 [Capsicum chinense]
MLAGCSSSLLSPRHRLRSEASAQFQACNFPSMSTQRLDLPCSFARKDTSRSQAIRPVGLSVEKPIEAKNSSCSLKQNIRLPPSSTSAQTSYVEGRRESKDEFWEKGRSLKRYAEQGCLDDETCMSRAKRKKGNRKSGDCSEEGYGLSLRQLGGGDFWLQSGFNVARSVPLIAGLHPPQAAPFSFSCSGEEESVCYVPSEVISPPPPLSNNPWIESVVTEITNFGDKNASTSQDLAKETSVSSASLDSHGLVLRPNEIPGEHEVGNGSRQPNPNDRGEVVAAHNGHNNHREDDAAELISLLVSCAEAIGSRNVTGVNQLIARLGQLASPRGSPISRLTAYFTEALALRVARLWPHIFHIVPPRDLDRLDDDSSSALRLLNQVSPIPKFIHFTSNEILLRAFEGKDRVHIIDFDIKQGLQWPSLFQSLASRPNPPTHVRITGIGESKQDLVETGDRLAEFAEALNLAFEFHPVVDRLEDVRLWMLHVKEGESVAVNCVLQMHRLLYDNSGGILRDFLGLIRSTNPTIILLAEQEAAHNEPSLDARLVNSLRYYAAVFDSIGFNLPLDSPARIKIEELFAREIRNIIACEGRDRTERHECFGKWRNLMEQGSFRCTGITERELLQSQMLLKMYSCEDYRVTKQGNDDAALTLSWLDQPLCTVSAWAPIDAAGSSSSYYQPS